MDFASPDPAKRKPSILEKAIGIAKELNAKNVICHPGGIRQKPTRVDAGPLLGSMRELKAYAPSPMELLLENMPDIYWYNGALHSACLFKREGEIKGILNELGMGLCMDLSHAKLYCNASGQDLTSYVRTLKPYVRHIHIADSRGIPEASIGDARRLRALCMSKRLVPFAE